MSTKHQASVLYAAIAAACVALPAVPATSFAQAADAETEQAQPEEVAAADEASEADGMSDETEAEASEDAASAAEEAASDQAAPAEATPAVEQTPPAAEEEEDKVEDIYVTGSRIKRTDLSTPAPVTVLDRQTLDASGLASIGEILQNLPSQSNGINLQFNNGGDGSTRVNLRGLGSNRTLVLLNGRRFVAGGTGANSSVDLNAIPAEIIERVEILKDGASAVYGSDAVSGVVNIITKKDFSGVEGSLYLGGSQHGGLLHVLGVTAGETTDRGGFLLSFQYFNQSELMAGKRDFSRSDLSCDYEEDGQPCVESTLGSSATPEGLIIDRLGQTGNGAWQNLNSSFGDDVNGLWFNDPTVGWRPARLTGNSDVGEGDFYNYQPENYLLTPSQRYSFYGQGHFDISDYIRVYSEATYTNRQSDQLLAPTPLFIITEGISISNSNVYNPFGRDFIDVRRRMVEAGNRQFLQDIDTYRFVVGLDGRLPDGLGILSTFTWDANFVYGRTEGTSINGGRFVRSRVINALGPSFIDSTGQAVCGTPGSPIDGCVPLNLFGGPGSISQDMLNYISYTGTGRGFTQQQLFTLSTSGELFELWNRPVGISVGYQFRAEKGADLPDPLTASGDTTGNKGEPTAGDFTENAGFIEIGVPLLADLPAVKLLEISAALRLFDFDTFGFDNMWKVGGRWQIIDDVALRGTVSRAFRAPSIGELFSGTADSFPNDVDPCADDAARAGPMMDYNTDLNRSCEADGVPRGYRDDRSQLQSKVGGNPTLDPETAQVFTAGLVFTPKFNEWLKGLSLAIDYFSISMEETITSIGTGVILSNCYLQPSRPDNCQDLVVRDSTGFLVLVNDTQQNVGKLETAGLDISLAYKLKTDIGRWGFNFDGTWTQKYDLTQADGRIVEGVGVYDLGVFPSFRFNMAVVWGFENFGAGVNLRWIGDFEECENDACKIADPNATDDPTDPNDALMDNPNRRNVGSNTTADLWVSTNLSTPIGFTQISVGINNIADQKPQTIYNGFLANSDASTYDFLGRYFYLSARQQF